MDIYFFYKGRDRKKRWNGVIRGGGKENLNFPKLSRHIKLNPTNNALLLQLLQEVTQKYRKLTD